MNVSVDLSRDLPERGLRYLRGSAGYTSGRTAVLGIKGNCANTLRRRHGWQATTDAADSSFLKPHHPTPWPCPQHLEWRALPELNGHESDRGGHHTWTNTALRAS